MKRKRRYSGPEIVNVAERDLHSSSEPGLIIAAKRDINKFASGKKKKVGMFGY